MGGTVTDTSKSGSSSESKSIRQHQEASVVLISYVGSFNSPVGAQLNLCGVRVPDTEALPPRPEAHPAREENGACLRPTVSGSCYRPADMGFNVPQNHISTPGESQPV